MIADAVTELRTRFARLTQGKNIEFVAPAVGVHSNTLYRFRVGGNVGVPILAKIEAWCDAQEGRLV